jgi:hypothetical protein
MKGRETEMSIHDFVKKFRIELVHLFIGVERKFFMQVLYPRLYYTYTNDLENRN